MYSKLGRVPLQHEFYPIGIQFNFRRVPSEIHMLHTLFMFCMAVSQFYMRNTYLYFLHYTRKESNIVVA